MRDVLSSTALPKLTRHFLRFDSICNAFPPFLCISRGIAGFKPTTCYHLLIWGLTLKAITWLHKTWSTSTRGEFCKFIHVWSLTWIAVWRFVNNSPFLFHRNNDTLIFLHNIMDLALKEKRYHGRSMFIASAFMWKSRWISSFFPHLVYYKYIYTQGTCHSRGT